MAKQMLKALLLGLIVILAVGCGKNGEAHDDSEAKSKGNIIFHFAEEHTDTVPVGTEHLQFQLYDGPGGSGNLVETVERRFSPMVTLEGISGDVQSAVITTLGEDDSPTGKVTDEVTVVPREGPKKDTGLAASIIGFLSLTALCAGLGMDNGLLVELSIRGLKLDEKKHMFWRSVALFCAAGLRIIMLMFLNSLLFLHQPLPDSWYKPIHALNPHGEQLTWMNIMFLGGGLIIVAMAFWEMYHKYRALRYAEVHNEEHEPGEGTVDKGAVIKVFFYLLVMNIIFSLDSVFTAVAMMDLETQFYWMCAAVLTACVIMIVGMVPLSKLIMKSRHFSVTMLVVLVLIAAKLIVDGVGGHFPNSVLILLLVAIFGNDAAQSFFDRAAEMGELELKAGTEGSDNVEIVEGKG